MPIDWNWISLLTTEIKTSILESSTQHLAPMVQSRSCRSFWPLAVLLFLAAHFHPAAGKMESFDGKMEVYTAPGDDKQLSADRRSRPWPSKRPSPKVGYITGSTCRIFKRHVLSGGNPTWTHSDGIPLDWSLVSVFEWTSPSQSPREILQNELSELIDLRPPTNTISDVHIQIHSINRCFCGYYCDLIMIWFSNDLDVDHTPWKITLRYTNMAMENPHFM